MLVCGHSMHAIHQGGSLRTLAVPFCDLYDCEVACLPSVLRIRKTFTLHLASQLVSILYLYRFILLKKLNEQPPTKFDSPLLLWWDWHPPLPV